MKKKMIITILIIIMLLTAMFFVIRFTDLGQQIVSYFYNQYGIKREVVTIEKPEKIKITYTYGHAVPGDKSFEIEVTDENTITALVDSISNQKLRNETKAGIMLYILGNYTVDFGNSTTIKFDEAFREKEQEYIKLKSSEMEFITQIDNAGLNMIRDIIDVRLTGETKKFKTDKVTVSNKQNEKVNIERKSALEYLLKQCKYIYTEELENDKEIDIAMPDERINFNNGIGILKYDNIDSGFLFDNGKQYRVYQLGGFVQILEYAFQKSEEKEKWFHTNEITITSPDKTVKVTNIEAIEKIATAMIYSDIQERDWLLEYDITSEYENGTKIKMNDYEYLIPGDKRIGNRYIISKDKKLQLCFPLYEIEGMVNDLLKND